MVCTYCLGHFEQRQARASQRFCSKLCANKDGRERKYAREKAVRGLRRLIRYFTCVDCGKLGVCDARGPLRQRHHPCAKAHNIRRDAPINKLGKVRRAAAKRAKQQQQQKRAA